MSMRTCLGSARWCCVADLRFCSGLIATDARVRRRVPVAVRLRDHSERLRTASRGEPRRVEVVRAPGVEGPEAPMSNERGTPPPDDPANLTPGAR